MKTHELKIWSKWFDDVAAGRKTAELRRNDRDYSVGDILVLREWFNYPAPGVGHYTGRHVTVEVTCVSDIDAIVPGYVLLSISVCNQKDKQWIGVDPGTADKSVGVVVRQDAMRGCFHVVRVLEDDELDAFQAMSDELADLKERLDRPEALPNAFDNKYWPPKGCRQEPSLLGYKADVVEAIKRAGFLVDGCDGAAAKG